MARGHLLGLTRHAMHFFANDLVCDLVEIDRQRIGDLGELRPSVRSRNVRGPLTTTVWCFIRA